MPESELTGKLPPDVLKNDVFSRSGAVRPDVLVGPGLGEDAALIRWEGAPYLVAAADPVVGAIHGAGRLLVHVNANDVACKGGDPAWFVVTLIVPTQEGMSCIRRVMAEIHETCASLGIAVVGGHTELTDRYDRPVIAGTMIGPSRHDLRAGKIQEGDVILVTKHAGLEGMSIIAHDRPDLFPFLSGAELAEVRSWRNDLSVLKEARLLRDLARYMHDPTEGGLLGGIAEIREARGLDAVVSASGVPLSPLTAKAARNMGFDPLRLISSGVLLAVLSPDKAGEAEERLSGAGVAYKIIGRFEASRHPSREPADTHEELWGILNRP